MHFYVCRLDRWRWQTKMNARLKQLGQPNIPDMQIHPLFFLPPLKTTPLTLTHTQTASTANKSTGYERTCVEQFKTSYMRKRRSFGQLLAFRELYSQPSISTASLLSLAETTAPFVLSLTIVLRQLSEIMVIEVMQQCSNRITKCRGGERTMPCNIIFEFYQQEPLHIFVFEVSLHLCTCSSLKIMKLQFSYNIFIK